MCVSEFDFQGLVHLLFVLFLSVDDDIPHSILLSMFFFFFLVRTRTPRLAHASFFFVLSRLFFGLDLFLSASGISLVSHF